MQHENKKPINLQRKVKKAAIVILVIVTAYTIFGFFGLPLIIRSMLPDKLSAALNRKVSIEKVQVNPYVLSVNIQGITVADGNGKIFASIDQFFVNLQISSLFKRALILKDLKITKPSANIVRNADGTFNFSDIAGTEPSKAPAPPETKAQPALAFAVESLQIENGRIAYGDNAPAKPFKTIVEPLNITLRDLNSLPHKQAAYTISATTSAKETIEAKGTFALFPFQSQGNLSAHNISFATYAPYYQDSVNIDVAGGVMDVQTEYRFSPQEPSKVMILSRASVKIDSLKLKNRQNQEDFCVIPSLAVDNIDVDAVGETVTIGTLSSKNGFLLCKRLADGSLNLSQLTAAQTPKKNIAPKPPVQSASATEAPWQVNLNHFMFEDYTIRAEDLTPTDPVKIIMDQIELTGQDFTPQPQRPGQVSLSLRWNKNGHIAVNGPMTLNPVTTNFKVSAKGVDIRSFQPYFADKVRLIVTDGDFNTNGRLSFSQKPAAAPDFSYQGEASVTRFASVDRKSAQDFLKWKSFHFENLKISFQPLKLFINKVSLTDFYSRLIINPDGTINIRTIFAPENAKKDVSAQTSTKPAAKSKQAPAPDIKINHVVFQGGSVQFSDRLAGERFDTDISDLGGKISGLSSNEQSRADVFLKGKHAGSAPLEIQGKINPLIANRYADLKLTFKDIELSPFSPYSEKYLGYILQKGKLNIELAYKVLDNKIQGKNRIFFDQMTLGDKVDSPDATSLPVKLGIALLKDSKGEINLDFPVNGDLNDPKFNIGKIVVKAIVNLFVKIISSPFAALSSMFGGGAELSYVDFEYGSAHINAAMEERLNSLATALNNRPALQLEIQGSVDPENDSAALRNIRFDNLLKAQKLKDMVKSGLPAAPLASVKIEPQDTEKYLKKAYDASEIPKPRDEAGKVKKLPAAEMEKLLFTGINITNEDLRLLAHERSAAIKDYLLSSGKIDTQRIFIIEPRSLTAEDKKEEYKGRVNFSLK
jgi:hypothetical protein